MKKRRTKPTIRPQSESSPDEIRAYLEKFYDQHQAEWHAEILDPHPEWIYLLGVHLRLIELEKMESALEEVLL
jgi:hypothetical protein